MDAARLDAAAHLRRSKGCSDQVAARAAYCLHPLDDRLFTSFGFGRAIRRSIRSARRRFANSGPEHVPGLAVSAMEDYLAIARRHGEAYYITRFAETLAEWSEQ